MLADWMKRWQRPDSEADAIQLALSGGWLARARLAWTSGMALARDTTDTKQVLYLAIAVDRDTLLRIHARLESHPEGRELIRSKAAIDSSAIDYVALRALPEETLGGAYARMLQAKGLDADFFQRPPGLPEDIAYVAQRARQTHDVWHVLTGLHTDVPGEIALQAFSHAQLHQNFSRLIVGFGLLFYGLRYPQAWGMAARARRAGRAAEWFLPIRWEAMWELPLAEVRTRVGLPREGLA